MAGRKTGLPAHIWRQVFAYTARYCSEHKQEYGGFTKCMKELLTNKEWVTRVAGVVQSIPVKS